jgi:hypothetical protein
VASELADERPNRLPPETAFYVAPLALLLVPEELDQHAVPQAAIAYHERLLAELRHDRYDD